MPAPGPAAIAFVLLLFAIILGSLAIMGRWYFIQGAIFITVVCGNIHYGWTPNPSLAIVLGVAAAAIVTFLGRGSVAAWQRLQQGDWRYAGGGPPPGRATRAANAPSASARQAPQRRRA